MSSVLKRTDTDMTTGSVIRHLLLFALPLMVGNLFQQLYNTVDSIVVGNFVGKEALAAVGSITPICNTLIGFFNGFASGAGVIISRYFGAHEHEKLHKAVQTTIAMTFLLSIVLTVIGVSIVPFMLRLMKTPDDVYEEAAVYLRIYFSGVSGLMFYNIGAGILRAVGDSRRPLYFLIFSTVTNIILDLFFVKVLNKGIAGAATATIIAQFASAILVMTVMSLSRSDYRISWKQMRIDLPILKSICIVGLPAALQAALISFSNVFVQSYVNRFGSSYMAGWSSSEKIESFVMLPLVSLGLSITTFVGQNLGAGLPERAHDGTKKCVLMGEVVCLFMLPLLLLLAPQLIVLFNSDPEVVEYGAMFLRLQAPFYMVVVINQVLPGALRGAGDSRSCMVITLCSFVLFRQIYLFTVYNLTKSIIPVALGYPAGWVVCSLIVFIYYRSGRWKKRAKALDA